MNRRAHPVGLAAAVLHDVHLAARRPSHGGDVLSEHPERRPQALLKDATLSAGPGREVVPEPNLSILTSYVLIPFDRKRLAACHPERSARHAREAKDLLRWHCRSLSAP